MDQPTILQILTKKDSNTIDQPNEALFSNTTQNPSTNSDLKIEISSEKRTNVTE